MYSIINYNLKEQTFKKNIPEINYIINIKF